MEREEVSVGDSVTVGDVTLLPIVRTGVRMRRGQGGIACSAFKQVMGIVVVSPTGRHALNIEGEEVPIDDYMHLVPGLRDLV